MTKVARMPREEVKTLSPWLAISEAWHEYVDAVWNQFERAKINWSDVALGFNAGYRAREREDI